MARDRTQGDPRIVIDGEGADLDFRAGQPVMDSGLENAVIISLFTRQNWFGNAFLKPNQKIGSRFLELAKAPITVTKLVQLQAAAKADLTWMLATGVASAIEVTVTNPQGNRIEATVTVTPPGKTATELTLTKHGPNWTAQANNPAYREVE
jgi:phage gp46-like protein